MNELASKPDATKKRERIEWLKELRHGIPKGSDCVTPRTLQIWAERLLGIPLPVLERAANLMADRTPFFPGLSEILEVCKEITNKNTGREWRERLDGYKQEALPQPEARKMLTALTEAASNGSKTAIVPFRRGRMFAKNDFVAGANISDEERERRKREASTAAGEPRPPDEGKEGESPNARAGGRGAKGA